MFNKTRKQITNTIEGIKAAFQLLIVTIEVLTSAVAANTKEQSSLRERLDTIGEHTGYLHNAKQRELQRSGHPHEL